MEIKCIITDDEPIARKGLRRYINKIDFLTLAGECENAIQLNSLLKSVQPDLLFLDIEMPQMTGFEFLANLRNPPKVIITSAYEQGYEFDIADYLLKPIPFNRFLKAVNKVHTLIESESQKEGDAYIFVKTEKRLKKIYLKEILFVESMENYIIIHTPIGKDTVSIRLKTVLDSLPSQSFMQVHRSFLVNLSHIQAIEGNLLIIGVHKIPVSRPFREEVYKAIINNQLISK